MVGLCVFLAYGTTASVARRLGAGDRRGALAQGIDGVWLAVVIGAVATVLGDRLHRAAGRAFGADATVADPATTYLRIAFLGTTPLLVMLATTGVLRGLQDTRTPLVVAVAGNRSTSRSTCSSCTAPDRCRAGHRRVGLGLGPGPGGQRRPRCSRSWSGPPGARVRR